MAAPMQQMPGQLIPQQQNRFGVGGGGQGMDFGHYAFQFIQSTPYVGPGWQTSVAITERVGMAQDLITSAVLASPSNPWQRLAHLCVQFEQNAFRECPDKATYHHKMREKTAEMHARRQNYTQQAAINQAQIAGSSSEPNQAGLQHLSNPTQINPGQPGLPMPQGLQREATTRFMLAQQSQMQQKQGIPSTIDHLTSRTGSNAKSDSSKPFSVSNDDKQMAQQHRLNQPNGINHSGQRLRHWQLDAKSLAGIVNKNTISKDNTISEEAQEAILLANMARKINRMMH